mmetsp:Transcript_9878/g.31331  ORF Transcript_9878/g.31331 Transcript_9878/m.31331 type:complete len:467 (+) Transcript_9878:112-1512(+)
MNEGSLLHGGSGRPTGGRHRLEHVDEDLDAQVAARADPISLIADAVEAVELGLERVGVAVRIEARRVRVRGGVERRVGERQQHGAPRGEGFGADALDVKRLGRGEHTHRLGHRRVEPRRLEHDQPHPLPLANRQREAARPPLAPRRVDAAVSVRRAALVGEERREQRRHALQRRDEEHRQQLRDKALLAGAARQPLVELVPGQRTAAHHHLEDSRDLRRARALVQDVVLHDRVERAARPPHGLVLGAVPLAEVDVEDGPEDGAHDVIEARLFQRPGVLALGRRGRGPHLFDRDAEHVPVGREPRHGLRVHAIPGELRAEGAVRAIVHRAAAGRHREREEPLAGEARGHRARIDVGLADVEAAVHRAEQSPVDLVRAGDRQLAADEEDVPEETLPLNLGVDARRRVELPEQKHGAREAARARPVGAPHAVGVGLDKLPSVGRQFVLAPVLAADERRTAGVAPPARAL